MGIRRLCTLWWARRPLAAARAVIWASLVDDPSGDESLTSEEQEAERQRLFGILERLVKWENSNNPEVLAEARAEIDRCFPEGPPPILDPFAGGGAIPLEAQRLGLKALAGDLNPVAVLINKAMIEIPPRFADMPPVHPEVDKTLTTWERAQGLAADVEAYGRWMRDEADQRIGYLYPDAIGPNGENLTPIAWIWARTVESPDPSWSGYVPLVASWTLANKPGKPKVWIEPIIDRDSQTISYEIRQGGEPSYERTVDRGGGSCIATGAAMPFSYIRPEFQSQRVGQQLMAIVCEGEGRSYVAPQEADLVDVNVGGFEASLSGEIFDWPGRTNVVRYGMEKWEQLFTPRQLAALTTFSDLLGEVAEQVAIDALAVGMADDGVRLRDGGSGALAYADAVITYLAFAVDRLADRSSTICSWDAGYVKIRNTFGRQAIPMTWDFAEGNPFSSSTGSWEGMVGWVRKAIEHLPSSQGSVSLQRDARARVQEENGAVISTDPPYYDNISYAVPLRLLLCVACGGISPKSGLMNVRLCSTPKAEELIANRHRAGSKDSGQREHFESGMAEFHVSEVARSQAMS